MGLSTRLLRPVILLILLRSLVGSQVTEVFDHSIDWDDFDHTENKKAALITNLDAPYVENHKPQFKNCGKYKPEVKENQERKTFVTKVEAEDVDPPDKKGGRLSYQIVKREAERTYFKMNNATGEIVTDTAFDRDEPNGQKEFYVTVQATDDGRPPLADTCTFKVTILDVNDNPPSFDQQKYDGKVSEDSKNGSEVMRVLAYDFDVGENARLTYSFNADNTEFLKYFRIDEATGAVYLQQSLQGRKQERFTSSVLVRDNGEDYKQAQAEISILVVGSDKQPPAITYYDKLVSVYENLTDFEKVIALIEAESNIDDKSVAFELVKGRTIQTNRDQTFRLTQSNNSARIVLGRMLNYESVTEYQLTVRVQNKDTLSASANIVIKVIDVNDEIPTFNELLKGSIVENDMVGAQAMQVRAIDLDGTSPNNLVAYKLLSHENMFEIDSTTGVITAKTTFDRETENGYHVVVQAYDGAPSAIIGDRTKPNTADQTFYISIEDTNDNHPKFEQSPYIVHSIKETTDLFKNVIEVKAIDKDDAALITYSIIEGNTDDAFMIEENTGRIKIKSKLDYEKIESYNLTVKAFDGKYNDTTNVWIYIQNENDELPVFDSHDKDFYILEESVSKECLVTLHATDPDIKDKTADQNIIYRVNDKPYLSVTDTGCVTVSKPLDRDQPNGSPVYQGIIFAYDNRGGPNTHSIATEFQIHLEDINDNAPVLNIAEVVWYENQPEGYVVNLTATDNDTPKNGPPFTFQIADEADDDIKEKFSIDGSALMANKMFDREEKKFYDVPIKIFDNGLPQQSGVSTLRVIIGDVNDNAAEDGSSEIFVYKYEGLTKDIKIGRVFVNDLDDWDLPDKTFRGVDGLDDNFYLNVHDKGMIMMRAGTPPGDYHLTFSVDEEAPLIPLHTVHADVDVTIEDITEEAVSKSGSVRLAGRTIEQFVEKEGLTSTSAKDILQQRLSTYFNTSLENVQVFTVLESPSNSSFVDVRFAAHGSPYYQPEKLENKISEKQDELERELGVRFTMVGISECFIPNKCEANSSCSNKLVIKEEPAVVFTNKTSFVGVQAVVEAVCQCVVREVIECLNGGTPVGGGCSCPEGYEGPHCEILAIGFHGDGWAMYPGLTTCTTTEISLSVISNSDQGLIFYAGPLTARQSEISKDFISLELENGFVVLKLDVGNVSVKIQGKKKKINDGAKHKITISLKYDDVQITVDECGSECTSWETLPERGLLNMNGPLQVGGRHNIFPAEESKRIWDAYPTNTGFQGCISNFTYNSFVYNLGNPADSRSVHVNCNYGVAQAVTFGIDSNFLVAILVCIAILLILLLAVVVHRRKQDALHEKDMDDTTENIINYEDEGGGESDAQFDIELLKQNMEEKPPTREPLYGQQPDVPADIRGFLDTKKHTCDKDPDNLPYDDVRHYGYEGDGNTSGSLSSLASCTDEGDLKFNYLSSFGPRFRKLADMYGDDASEEGSQNGGEESWC